MSKIKKITVSNLRQINFEEFDLNGSTVVIIGGNNKGKTTFARALMDRMRGNKENILREGQTEGGYEMELTTGEKFIWNLKGEKEKLTYISERNIKGSVTKDISTAYFPKVFDVDAFLNEIPSKQRDMLLKISGIDFTEINRMYVAAAEERTISNRLLADAKAKHVNFEPHWKNELQDANALQKQLEETQIKKGQFSGVVERLKIKKDQRDEKLLRIQEWKAKIAETESELVKLNVDIANGEVWIKDPANNANDEAIATLKEKLDDVALNNFAIDARKKLERATQNAADAQAACEKLLRDKDDALKASDLPEGFSITDEGILYNGLPFNKSHLSSSAIYIGALKLASVGVGIVRALHFDASFLDKNNLLEIEKWAEANDLQLLIERPDFEGGEIKYEILQQQQA